MMGFAELGAHEQAMLDLWMQYWADGYDGLLDDRDEDYGFEDWLAEQIEWCEEDGIADRAELYRQALAEWQA